MHTDDDAQVNAADAPRGGDAAAHPLPGRDPLGIIARQNATRAQDLVPLRAERMSASPFAFYRGTAAIMAADQGREAHSGILVASCGDAHISNFGLYASPQRTLLFDLNDFDEAAWAPWEWDLKRLVTSVIIGGRATDRAAKVVRRAARGAIKTYIAELRASVALSPLERYYTHFDPYLSLERLDKASRKALRGAIKSAVKRTGTRAAHRLTEETADGVRRFIADPPVLSAIDPDVRATIDDRFAAYSATANVDIRTLLSQYTIDDIARRVVGVGSVGTLCYVALLRDRTTSEPFVLQVKQAGRSVLEEYGGIRQPAEVQEAIDAGGEGARVVGLQRILQAYSDPFLGHLQGQNGDFYVRQFHDMKGGLEVESLEDVTFKQYSAACGRLLARGHSQSPRAAEVEAHIGEGSEITKSIMAWCESYAELSLADYREFAAQR